MQHAIDMDLQWLGINAKEILIPQHHVSHIAALNRARLLVDAQRFRGVEANPSNRALGKYVESGAVALERGLCGFLIEALDPLIIGVRVHDDTAAGWAVYQRDVFLHAFVGFNREAPPLSPEGPADIIFGELIPDLEGLYAVMERANAVTELLGHIENGEHLISAVAVHVHKNVAAQCVGQRIQFEVASWWCIGE